MDVLWNPLWGCLGIFKFDNEANMRKQGAQWCAHGKHRKKIEKVNFPEPVSGLKESRHLADPENS